MNLHENKKLFAESVLAAAKYLGINAVYIEKDYWITRSLFQMTKGEYASKLVFKGGTSLSKAYRLVSRFSEDIDIAVIDADAMNGNQLKTLIKRVAKTMTADLEEVVQNGVTSKGSHFYKAVYAYPNLLKKELQTSVNVGQLLVEINSFANPYPHEAKEITCFIHDFYKNTGNDNLIRQYAMQPFSLNVLNKRRTLTEKLVSLLRFSFSENYVYDVAAKIRHFYDLYYLAGDDDCAAYLCSDEFQTDLDALLKHDRQTFSTPVGWQTKTLNESPLITNFSALWQRLKDTYNNEMPAISFAAIPNEKDVAQRFEQIIKDCVKDGTIAITERKIETDNTFKL